MAVFEPDETALQRVDFFDRERLREPQDDLRQAENVDAVSLCPPQNRLDMLRRLIDRPGVAIELFPIRLGHVGVRGERVFEIVFVEVGISGTPLLNRTL